jgi:hypothetical protein
MKKLNNFFFLVSNASHKHFANTIESQNDVPAMIFSMSFFVDF